MVREEEAGAAVLTGTHVAGSGVAHRNIGSAKKCAEHTEVFGCPMVGTFNVQASGALRGKPFLRHGADSYWLIRLCKEGRECYAYAVRWEGSKLPQNRLELLSKRPIPDFFKRGELEVFVYERWSAKQIEAWQAALDDKTKWQGHDFWQPQRADSTSVWLRMKEGYDFRNKTVLDIGCNAGYYAFRAARLGAVVTGVEKNNDILKVARTIQNHIEMTDVDFRRGSYADLLDHHYDFIFYLSVHHQHDRSYMHLRAALSALSERCSVLFLELINPPLSGGLTKEAVDAIVLEASAAGSGPQRRGRTLAHYQHGVRGMRSLYVL